MEDVYYTIRQATRHEIKVRGSRFIGECAEVTTVEAAMAYLGAVRKREHAATHHCYAYTVGLHEDMLFKYSDDGEPSGTAGRPIYDVAMGRGLSNTIVVVTRYFGGTKLGTGGLVRAYSEAAIGVLEAADRKENYLTTRYDIVLDFHLYDLLNKVIHRFEARQVDAEFTDRVRAVIEVRRSLAEALQHEIVQLSGGKAKIAQIDEKSES